MSYIINNSRGQLLVVVPDGTTNTTATSVSLIGQGVTNFGTAQNENFVYMVENFANDVPPSNPITGQLWYNTSTDIISSYSTANTWVTIASQDYVQAQKISPAFTGIPTAPTAANTTNTAQLATTAFVQNVTTNQYNYNLATYAPLISPGLSGIPTAPTANTGTSTTQIATTEFVTSSPAFAGVPTAPTANATANTTQIATTSFVQLNKVSPAFTGTPTAPTANVTTNTTQIATTAFVQLNKVSPAFTGVPTAPTANVGTANTQIATTAFVANVTGNLGSMSQQNANNVTITGGSITGITALPITSGGTGATDAGTARTNLGLKSMALQASNTVSITGGSITGISPMAIADGGTGANDATGARTALGLGTISTQNSNSIAITGGTISGLSSALAIADGGTGATDAANARSGLGLGSIATQNANNVSITGGTITATSVSASNVNISGSVVATKTYVDDGLLTKVNNAGGGLFGPLWTSYAGQPANVYVMPTWGQVNNYSTPQWDNISGVPSAKSWVRIYSQLFTWGNGVTSGTFQWDLNNPYEPYSQDNFLVAYTGAGVNWYWSTDAGRISTWNLTKNNLWKPYTTSSYPTYLSRLQAVITCDGYPMPAQMRVEVYTTTPIRISNYALYSSTANISLYYSDRPTA